MQITARGTLSAAALIASAISAHAQATDSGVEMAFMPSTMTVTLLNEGGKYVAVDLKHIPQGGTCRMDKDAVIARVGAGASAGTTRVRYAAAQVSSGGCPFRDFATQSVLRLVGRRRCAKRMGSGKI